MELKEAENADKVLGYILDNFGGFIQYKSIQSGIALSMPETINSIKLINERLAPKGLQFKEAEEDAIAYYSGKEIIINFITNGGFEALYNAKYFSGMTPKEIIINKILNYLKTNGKKARYEDIDNALFNGEDTVRRYFSELYKIGVVSRESAATDPIITLNKGFENYKFKENGEAKKSNKIAIIAIIVAAVIAIIGWVFFGK